MTAPQSRPLDAEERRTLARLASRGQDRAQDAAGIGCGFMVAFALGIGAIRLFSGPPSGAALGIAAGVAACVALAAFAYVRRTAGRAIGAERDAFAADLRGGRVVAETFDVLDAIHVEEREDEGSTYYLKLADGSVLVLRGQYLYDVEGDGSFPSTRVTLTRAPQSRLVFDLACVGRPLPASSERPPFTREEYRAGAIPADGDVLAADFESLRGRR